MFRLARRGANAIEFALVMPVVVATALGTLDYGWFFLNQWQVVRATNEAVRFGAIQVPADSEGQGSCALCVASATTVAKNRLANQGLTVSSQDVTPTIVTIEGTCALQMTADITHDPIVGFVPLPDTYRAQAIWVMPNVFGC